MSAPTDPFFNAAHYAQLLSAGSGGGGALDLVGYASRQAQFPTFVKHAGNPIFTPAQIDASWPGSPNWPIVRPQVIRVDGLGLTSPLGKYYMYFSTDHATDFGGIGLAYANSPLGPWTYYGLVYQDTTGGSSQTEWPSIIWNEDEGLFFLYHHVVGLPGVIGGQVTCLATSPNGVDTWTRVGPVIDVGLNNASNGNDYWNGGTSYASVFRVAGRWYAYGFAATANYNRCYLAGSNDGRSWVVDPRYLGNLASVLADPTQRHIMALNHLPIWWQGRLWAVTVDSSWVAGVTPNPSDFLAAPLTTNLRRFAAKPKKCVSSTLQGWETTFMKIGSVLVDDGKAYLYYRSGNPTLYGGAGEGFGVAVATQAAV